MNKNTGKFSQLVNSVKAHTHKITKDVSSYNKERLPEAKSKATNKGISNR